LESDIDPASVRAIAQSLAADFDGVRVSGGGAPTVRLGSTTVDLEVEGRVFTASPATFFQSNRFLVGELSRDVRELASGVAPGEALDAFAGVGLFAGALLDAGHRVVSVESGAASVRSAERARVAWRAQARWQIVASDLDSFARRGEGETDFDLVVADPPRAGLGRDLAGALARRSRSRFLYVSCDPATLARDLPAILEEGFRIVAARLYDFYLFTHRIEALVALERAGPA
jgi:tRNA/tmRNA/rRNA uracil-C5-methylase (TrmA/RlmC/RlmD family)